MISELTRARMSSSAGMRRKRDQNAAEHAHDLFTQLMLNGKELRYCTFAEVATFGERYAKLARMGERDQVVGRVLSEKQVMSALFGYKPNGRAPGRGLSNQGLWRPTGHASDWPLVGVWLAGNSAQFPKWGAVDRQPSGV